MRSQETCLFRQVRPTIALRQDEEGSNVLCALCLHPTGNYSYTGPGSDRQLWKSGFRQTD
jgi:hypothetical protein